jgi:hypothetical protein
LLLSLSLGMLALWRREDHRHWIPQFHDIIHQDFYKVGSRRFELHLGKDRHIRRMEGGILKREFDLALPQDGGLVGSNQPGAFRELPDASGPPIE